jgi:hypothetical protein
MSNQAAKLRNDKYGVELGEERKVGAGGEPQIEAPPISAKPARWGKQHRSKRSRLQPEDGLPVLDERIPSLLLDSLLLVQSAIASATTGVPYGVMRQAMASSEEEKRDLTRAVQAAAAKHSEFFTQHREVIEFAAIWTAIHAQKVNAVCAAFDAMQAESGQLGGKVCSIREALVDAVIILAPLVLLTIVVILQRRSK